ncbi:MAG: hypothetical protein Q9165_007461 [Trypethelium subeluteriae]
MADNTSDQFTMASFLDLLAQNQPQFQTRSALIILGLQNDFVAPQAGFLEELQPYGFLDRIKAVIPQFREKGEIVWARSEYAGDVTVNDSEEEHGERVIYRVEEKSDDVAVDSDSEEDHDDVDPLEADVDPSPPVSPTHPPDGMTRTQALLETIKQDRARSETPEELQRLPTIQRDEGSEELFLDKAERLRVFCIAGTWGAEIEDSFKPFMDESRDLQIIKTKYSAFTNTNLLLTLRTKLVTEIYLCGVLTNMSIYATAMDAARHGLVINVLEDCCGYRHRPLHDESVKQMKELMGATMAISLELSKLIGNSTESDPVRSSKDREIVEGALERMTLSDSLPGSTSTGTPSSSNAANDAEVSRPRRIRQKPIVRRSGGTRERAEAAVSNTQQESGVSVPHPNRMYKQPRFRGKRESQRLKDEFEKVDARIEGAIAKLNDHLNSGVRLIEDARKPAALTDDEERLVAAVRQKEGEASIPATVGTKNSDQDLGPDDMIGEGDSCIIQELLQSKGGPNPAAGDFDVENIFQQLYDEVRWQKMFHQQGEVPRLVAVQGEIGEDGTEPVYRHPSDQALPTMRFSPAVQQIREQVQKALKHPVNHVLIQLYRCGADYISEHADKTLDIVHGSSIANASFGAQRTMRLRLKKSALTPGQLETYEQDPAGSRQTQRTIMPHNSLFILGPKTNMRWLHGINTDKRPPSTRTEAETAYGGIRISLTFRHIGTFISPGADGRQRIWGQGATNKSKETAKRPINDNPSESEKLVHAFGKENHESDHFDWKRVYGNGSDVLHLRESPENTPILFLGLDRVQNLRVKMWLEELALPHATVEAPPEVEFSAFSKRRGRTVAFRDTDSKHTEVDGALEILAYLDRTIDSDGHTATKDDSTEEAGHNKDNTSLHPSFLYESVDIYTLWLHHFHVQFSSPHEPTATPHPLYFTLKHRDSSLDSNGFLAGATFTIVDCAIWPVIREMRYAMGTSRRTDLGRQEFDKEFPRLWAWFGRVEGRGATKRAMR